MRLLKKTGYISLLAVLCMVSSPLTYAATSPSLGMAETFSVLSNTYVNTTTGTTLSGDLGYTTGPASPATVGGTIHAADATYAQAGVDQASALTALNSQACTYTFPAGAVNLATDTTHGTIGVYTPGVYCTTATSAASIGAGGITLTGSGTYIFRINGALTTVANSAVALAGGASACTVWWTPTAATTLGANSTFAGTDIDASGVTIGSTVTWAGRALAFGGTVSTNVDTVNTPVCSSPPPPPTTTPVTTTTTTSGTSDSSDSTTPGLPNTGEAALKTSLPVWAIAAGIAAVALTAYTVQRKRHHR